MTVHLVFIYPDRDTSRQMAAWRKEWNTVVPADLKRLFVSGTYGVRQKNLTIFKFK
jgi:hypothetical protein